MSLTILCYHFSKEKKNSFVYDDDDYRQTRIFLFIMTVCFILHYLQK